MLWIDKDKKQPYKIASPHKYKIQVKENTNSRKIKLKDTHRKKRTLK